MHKNLDIFAAILNTQVKKKFIGRFIEGYYKERKISVSYDRFYKYASVSIKITPQQIERKSKKINWRELRPTKNTFIWQNGIYYKEFHLTELKEIKDKSYILNILEELRKATEIVETGTAYYRE
ncbi:MAG: hypothetical protein WCY05_04230 [Candidatus Omnitrophota bacterium]